MFTKWKFKLEELSHYRIDEEGNIWRMPYESIYGYREWRRIKMQHPSRWRLNGKWWSKNQLRPHIIPDTKPIEIYQTCDLPF